MEAFLLTRQRVPLAMVLAGVASLTGVSAAPPVMAQAGILEEVIVTARKREEAIQDVPVSVTAFSGNQLRNAGITNLGELGYHTPGLQVDQSSSAQIWIRGIGQRDDGSRVDSPVGVYLDGLPLHPAQGRPAAGAD
jgi:outer membrane receptor protein involved in Fe transport